MKIQSMPPANLARTSLQPTPPSGKEANPFEMDRFELQERAWEADLKVLALQAKERHGQELAMFGMGALFASLGVMVAQSIASGGHLPPALAIPVAGAAAVGVGTFATGIWRRDSANMDVLDARLEARHLHSVYEKRFDSNGGR